MSHCLLCVYKYREFCSTHNLRLCSIQLLEDVSVVKKQKTNQMDRTRTWFFQTTLLAPGRPAPATCPDAKSPTRTTRRKEKKRKRKPYPLPTNSSRTEDRPSSVHANQLAPASLTPHARGPSFVYSLHKEPVRTPTSMGSAPPLALPAPSRSACR